MSHYKPKRFDGTLGRDLVLAICILAATSIISVAIGFSLHESQLEGWGSWLGAFIAGIALVASGYAIVVQARHGESTSWSIALGRLGELYDNAYAAPTDSAVALISYFSARKVFTVWQGGRPVGGFTISPEKDRMAAFSIVAASSQRGRQIMPTRTRMRAGRRRSEPRHRQVPVIVIP
jgi:hypothetical protein